MNFSRSALYNNYTDQFYNYLFIWSIVVMLYDLILPNSTQKEKK